jgi:hypothetical protein
MVVALGAEVWILDSGNKHEDPDPRGLWPDPALVVERTSNLAESASTALQVVASNPDLTGLTHIKS